MTQTHHEFTVEDANGEKHRYVGSLHKPTTDGIQISLQLAGLGLQPLIAGVKGILKESGGDIEKLIDSDVSTLLEKLDVDTVLEKLQPALLSDQLPGLPHRLMKEWTRDAKDLSNEIVFNECYRGNYLELIKAMIEVIKVNRFLPLPSIS
jgi:hypothetical protein